MQHNNFEKQFQNHGEMKYSWTNKSIFFTSIFVHTKAVKLDVSSIIVIQNSNMWSSGRKVNNLKQVSWKVCFIFTLICLDSRL